MIFRQLVALLLVLLSLLGIGPVVMGQTSPNTHQPTRMPTAKAKEAKKLFKQNCIKCHGADGAGETTFGQIVGAADFTDSEWQKRIDDQRLINSMTYGRGQMPPFGKKLTREQITTLLAYVRGFQK
jgi:mono/diheme cytochrome c family protein